MNPKDQNLSLHPSSLPGLLRGDLMLRSEIVER